MYVLDTNTVIYFFKGMGKVSEQLLSLSPADIGIPAIVIFEIETGLLKSNASKTRQQQWLDFTLTAQCLQFGRREATIAADIRAKLENSGTPIGPYDTLIAATALARNAKLVTHNVEELNRVPSLIVVDWY